jgi:NADH:ubiquinone oxidoreductase subunit 2 (subunit N)
MRSSPLLEYAPTSLLCITFVGAATAFFAASTGLLQNDIKRVIAYSTCSQMGYLFIAVGLLFITNLYYIPSIFLLSENYDNFLTVSMLANRAYVSQEDKVKISQGVSAEYTEVMTGIMLGDGTVRVNGRYALLSVQQINKDIVNTL